MKLSDSQAINKKNSKTSDLGRFIRKKRKQRCLTQKQLAEFAGVSFTFLNRVENGDLDIKVSVLNKVLNVFKYQLGPTVITTQESDDNNDQF